MTKEMKNGGRVLVVGATGVVGGLIVRGLVEKGNPVRALVRPGSNVDALKQLGVELVEGDLKEPSSLGPACAGVDIVVSTANSAARAPPDTVESVDLAGTRALIEAAVAAEVAQFVYISAAGASPDVKLPFIRAKAASEEVLKASGLDYTILRPDMFTEIWVGMLVAMPASSGAPVTFLSNEDRTHSFVSVMDVAAAAVATVGNVAAYGQTVPFGGPEALSWREVTERFGTLSGQSLEIQSLPPTGQLPGLPTEIGDFIRDFERDTAIDNRQMMELLGVSPTSFDDTLRAMLSGPSA